MGNHRKSAKNRPVGLLGLITYSWISDIVPWGKVVQKKCLLKQYDTLGKVSVKRLYCFKSQKFWVMKQQCFYAKNLDQQSDCIVSNPRNFWRWSNIGTFTQKNLYRQSGCIVSYHRIFKGEAIQVLLRKKIWIDKAIVLLQTPEALTNKAIQFL